MPGPAASHDPVRRNVRAGTLKLPAEGRKGRAPVWPLDDQLPGEPQLWKQLWSTPQAVAWERLNWTRTVARYARVLLGAERLDKDCMSEARQLEDRLGLTPKSMRMLLWEVVSDEVAQKRQTSAGARGRIKAVG